MIEILAPTNTDRVGELRSVGYTFVDGWASALPELLAITRFDPAPEAFDERNLDPISRYVVYPWRRTVVRLPEDRLWHRLRTARNRYLITDAEQDAWSSAVVAVAGLSVGASALHVCALTGARHFRIADPDTLGPTNLNRLSASVCDLDVPKTVIAKRRVLEADPYAQVTTLDGYFSAQADEFFGTGGNRAEVILEEMDDLAMKVDLRRQARAARIPVVMVTDDGDDVIIDVERYDLDGDYPLFHGRAPGVAEQSTEELRDPTRRVALAGVIVGDDVAPRLKVALGEVGRSIVSWPQLGSAATLAGAVGAVVARKIVCGADVPSGRVHVRVAGPTPALVI